MWSDDEEDEDEGAGKSDDEEEKWKVKCDKMTINGKISQGMYSLYHMVNTSSRPCHLARRRKLRDRPIFPTDFKILTTLGFGWVGDLECRRC